MAKRDPILSSHDLLIKAAMYCGFLGHGDGIKIPSSQTSKTVVSDQRIKIKASLRWLAVGTGIHSSHSLIVPIQHFTPSQFENVDVKWGRHFLNTPKI